ncbi:MAG: cation:proton antiporter [Spirochaeta sp.]|jgi:Kef-type K+ transport system membrane component KefB|nr:cation:proton antiporter [Spirochaeta sp.]
MDSGLLTEIIRSPVVVVGFGTVVALYTGKFAQLGKLPSIIGFMLLGALLGPSLLHVITDELQSQLSFISDIALGFVALSIGMELSFTALRKQGGAIVAIIFSESIFTFLVVTAALGFLTGNWPFALVFGAIAPASAPAGTVAIIQEYRAKGPLTQALYSVVGFDDGLGIVIFGFASAIAVQMMSQSAMSVHILLEPFLEIVGSLGVGVLIGLIGGLLASRLESKRDVLTLSFGFVLLATGLSTILNLSLILTNLVIGITIVNSQRHRTTEQISQSIGTVMPLLFTLFFLLAGAHLELSALPALGLIGVVYMAARSFGLIGGAWIGSRIGGAEPVIAKNLGLGILSQAGVAIGLALYVQQTFQEFGDAGAWIGTTIITTVTATSVIFEVIGPILTRIALTRAGEISTEKADH